MPPAVIGNFSQFFLCHLFFVLTKVNIIKIPRRELVFTHINLFMLIFYNRLILSVLVNLSLCWTVVRFSHPVGNLVDGLPTAIIWRDRISLVVMFGECLAVLGNVAGLVGPSIVYTLVCVIACFATQKWMVYLIAAMIGFAMGGIQSLFRSTYSKLLPATKDHASFFSFFDITEKVAIVLGLFIYAGVEVIASEMEEGFAERLGVATLGFFFVIGLMLLRRLSKFKSLEPTVEDTILIDG